MKTKRRKGRLNDRAKLPVSPVRTDADREALADILSHNARNAAMFLLGITSALRIRDLLSLRVGDVVVGGLDRIRVAERVTVRERKTGKVKSFPVHPRARRALRNYLRERRPADAGEALFLSRQHVGENLGPISREQAWRIISAAGELAGLPYRIGTHSMRKTFGYLLYRQTKDIALVQKTLNHSTPQHTLRYIGIEQEEIDTAHLSIDI